MCQSTCTSVCEACKYSEDSDFAVTPFSLTCHNMSTYLPNNCQPPDLVVLNPLSVTDISRLYVPSRYSLSGLSKAQVSEFLDRQTVKSALVESVPKWITCVQGAFLGHSFNYSLLRKTIFSRLAVNQI